MTHQLLLNGIALKNTSKHVEQIVIEIPPQNEVPPIVDNLVAMPMMAGHWVGTALFLDDKGPFIFVKATGVVEKLKGCFVNLAFSFYKLKYGGLIQVFVYVPSSEIEASGNQFITEAAYWLDDKEHRELIEALISLTALLHF